MVRGWVLMEEEGSSRGLRERCDRHWRRVAVMEWRHRVGPRDGRENGLESIKGEGRARPGGQSGEEAAAGVV